VGWGGEFFFCPTPFSLIAEEEVTVREKKFSKPRSEPVTTLRYTVPKVDGEREEVFEASKVSQ
jgi:hypothetical protein